MLSKEEFGIVIGVSCGVIISLLLLGYLKGKLSESTYKLIEKQKGEVRLN
jgi:hypothetical protein